MVSVNALKRANLTAYAIRTNACATLSVMMIHSSWRYEMHLLVSTLPPSDKLSFWDVITMSITAWLLLLALLEVIKLFDRR